MKKILIFTFVCIILTGCGKENNITINYYNNDKDKIAQKDIKENIIEEIKNNDTNINSEVNLEIFHNNEILNNSENTNNNEVENLTESDSSIKDESKTNKIKNWYKNNKDELKDISNNIIKEDIDKIENIVDNTTDWYKENKEDLKESANKIYNNDKDILNDLYKKIKKVNN